MGVSPCESPSQHSSLWCWLCMTKRTTFEVRLCSVPEEGCLDSWHILYLLSLPPTGVYLWTYPPQGYTCGPRIDWASRGSFAVLASEPRSEGHQASRLALLCCARFRA